MENAFDILDRVTNTVYRSGAGTAVRSFAYAYDPDGLLTQKVSVVADGLAVTNVYAYDGLGRLVSADGVSYTYDLAGNRLTRRGGGPIPTGYRYDHNRLVSAFQDVQSFAPMPEVLFAYDSAGNVTNTADGHTGITRSLVWNTQGQLVSVATNGAFAESYAYDPLGRLAATTTYQLNALGALTPLTTYHVYDGVQCVADLDANGTPLRTYAWGPGIDNLLAVTVYSYQSNSLQPTASAAYCAITKRLIIVLT